MRKIFSVLLLLFVFNGFLNATIYYSIADGYWTNSGGSGIIVWSLISGGTAVSAGTYPKKGDIIHIEGHDIDLDYDLRAQNGIELYVDVGSSLIAVGTEGILIKTGGVFQVDGYVEVEDVELKNGTTVNITSLGELVTNDFFHNGADITLDGVLDIGGLFTNTATIIGTGTLTADSYNNTGSLFGVTTNPTAGSTIGGATWDGSTGSDWNTATNWANGTVPNNTYNVVITTDGTDPIITGSRNAKSITINSGAILTIASSGDLSVVEEITNNAGNTGLVIQTGGSTGDGSLIHESEAPPPSTIERNVPAGAWHLIACPTDAGNTSDFYDAADDAWFLNHTEVDNTWTHITDISYDVPRNKGFSYWVTTEREVVFTGNLTKVDQVVTLDYSGSNDNDGWNLLGNPFTAALDWDNPNWDGDDINTTGTVYVWDGSSGDYKVWNSNAGTLTNGTIPMAQGFFVKATSAGSFKIPKAARFHSRQPFYKSNENTDPTQYVSIQLDAGGHINTVFVGFPGNGTDSFDYRGDADKLYSSNETPQLFATENNKKLCINANAPLQAGESKTVPLNLVQVIDGEYSLSITKLDQLENTSIVLEDVKTGLTQDFRSNTTYSFEAYHDDDPNRFLLHFTHSPNGVEQELETTSNIQIYSFGNEIYIRSSSEAINQGGNVFVYDLMGRELFQQNIESGELIKFPVNITNNYVVVKVIKSSSTKIQKVYIK